MFTRLKLQKETTRKISNKYNFVQSSTIYLKWKIEKKKTRQKTEIKCLCLKCVNDVKYLK